jgi:alpha-L-rhamnosidase
MNSFNHYAYGAIGDWMYRVSAGIEILEPGYKYILIRPEISEKLAFSKAEFESRYGKIASGWERNEGKVTVSVTIPANTKARIVLPVQDVSLVTEGGNPLSANSNISDITMGDDSLTMETGSGSYKFTFKEQ